MDNKAEKFSLESSPSIKDTPEGVRADLLDGRDLVKDVERVEREVQSMREKLDGYEKAALGLKAAAEALGDGSSDERCQDVLRAAERINAASRELRRASAHLGAEFHFDRPAEY